MTVLKQIYYRDYAANIGQEVQKPERIIIYRQLSELLLNEKYYISLTKRNNNFKILDDAIKSELHKKRDDIDSMITKCMQISCDVSEKEKEEDGGEGGETKENEKPGKELSLNGTLDALREIQEYCGDKKEETSFIASLLNRKFDAINKENGHFYDIVREAVRLAIKDLLHSEYSMIDVDDCIVAPVVFKVGVGTDAPIYFYDVGGDKKFAVLTDVSRIVEILGYELQHFPPFYLYIMLHEPERDTAEFEKEILISVGSKVAEGVFRDIQKIFASWEKS